MINSLIVFWGCDSSMCICCLATLISRNLSINVKQWVINLWRCKDNVHGRRKRSQQWANTTALVLLQRWALFAFDDPCSSITNMANGRPVFQHFFPCQEHRDFSHHLKCVYTPAGALGAMLSSITSMLINCEQLWSCEEANYFLWVYLQPKQRRQSFHSLSRVVADLMWDSTAFFVTLLCLRRLHFAGEQVLKCALTRLRILQAVFL